MCENGILLKLSSY